MCFQNYTHEIVRSSAMHYQILIIIHECSKKLLKMKNSKSFFLTPSTYVKVECGIRKRYRCEGGFGVGWHWHDRVRDAGVRGKWIWKQEPVINTTTRHVVIRIATCRNSYYNTSLIFPTRGNSNYNTSL